MLDARTEMMMDATRGWDRPLTKKRLLAWHAALFPTGYSGLSQIRVAAFRDESSGPMQVVSRRGSLLCVHFEAPPADRLRMEMASLLKELNADSGEPLLVRVALAHLRFLTLHPFEDGNGRLARFWQVQGAAKFNVHQHEMLNRLLDGFEGNLTSSKWAKICKVSQDTASREIVELVSRGILKQEGSGRSTHYVLVPVAGTTE